MRDRRFKSSTVWLPLRGKACIWGGIYIPFRSDAPIFLLRTGKNWPKSSTEAEPGHCSATHVVVAGGWVILIASCIFQERTKTVLQNPWAFISKIPSENGVTCWRHLLCIYRVLITTLKYQWEGTLYFVHPSRTTYAQVQYVLHFLYFLYYLKSCIQIKRLAINSSDVP